MAFEINCKALFQDFNPSKFIVYGCLLLFSLLFSLKADGVLTCSYWVVFLPIWIWKILVLLGAIVGSWVWWRNPTYRLELDSYVQYKAMIICTGMHALLLMFELLACDKLENDRQPRSCFSWILFFISLCTGMHALLLLACDMLENDRQPVLWILVFIPLIFMSLVSIGICVWAVKNERSFELELFCASNILQFVFLALRLDEFLDWSWVIVLIPMWIVMCVALMGVLYALILALILLRSPELIPQQRRSNLFSAAGYLCFILPLLAFQILLVSKADGVEGYTWLVTCLPLFMSLITLMVLAFASKPANHWWFGIRRDVGPWILSRCPLLQEYANIAYKRRRRSQTSADNENEGDGGTTGRGRRAQYAPSASQGGSTASKQHESSLLQHSLHVNQISVSLETPD